MSKDMGKRIIQELEVVIDLQISQILVCRMFTQTKGRLIILQM